MKTILLVVFGMVALVLAVVLYQTKQGDTAQHNADSASMLDLSNDLNTVQAQYADNSATIVTLSNLLVECQSGSLTLSNKLADSQSLLSSRAEQIANLNAKVAEINATNQAVSQRATDLAGQVNTLTQQLSLSQTNLAGVNESLAEANKEYALLENRFRVDVAERLVMQRKFYNRQALQAQLQNLKYFPYDEVSADMIYAGLDVEVRSNGTFHVISPN